MRPDSLASDHEEPQCLRALPSFHVEVVQNLHVIRKEPDRVDEDVFGPATMQGRQVIEDVRRKPGIVWPSALALVSQRPVCSVDPDFVGD
jgi:hypothetical protein